MNYPSVYDEAETLTVASEGRSLARFGDGELKLAMGKSAKSQQFDPALKQALREVLADPGGPCLPCIPRRIVGGPKARFWEQYLGTPYTLLYQPSGLYGSAFVSRPDSAPAINCRPFWDDVERLWADRDVVLVRGSDKSLKPEHMRAAASVEEVLAARQHAWSFIDGLFLQLREEKRRVFLCLGATATVLAWRLAHEGVHALDVGHIGMFMKRIGPGGRIPAEALASKE